MAFPKLTPEIVAQARANNDKKIIGQLRCYPWPAEELTAGGADVTFTDECDAEVIIPAALPELKRMQLAVLAGFLPNESYSGRPCVKQLGNGDYKIYGLLD